MKLRFPFFRRNPKPEQPMGLVFTDMAQGVDRLVDEARQQFVPVKDEDLKVSNYTGGRKVKVKVLDYYVSPFVLVEFFLYRATTGRIFLELAVTPSDCGGYMGTSLLTAGDMDKVRHTLDTLDTAWLLQKIQSLHHSVRFG